MLFVDGAHERARPRQDVVDEDEYGLFRGKLDAFADDVDELAGSEVVRHEILLLIDGGDVCSQVLPADGDV